MSNQEPKNVTKEDYHRLINLYSRQEWLTQKEEQLLELMELCAASSQKKLVLSLLEDFEYISPDFYNYLLNELARYIIQKSGFTEKTTQIVACTRDEEADSGQRMLDQMKFALFKLGWQTVKTVNRIGDSRKNHQRGLTQIVLLDDFIGSGKTLKSRIRSLQNEIKNGFDLKCCFLIGMNHAVQSMSNGGQDIFCPLLLNRGISDKFRENDSALVSAFLDMKALEKKLAPQMGDKDLRDYSFGYERSQALCSLEGCNGNTPNNVFPIFWWPRDWKSRSRKNIVTRYEKGFYDTP